MRSYKDGLAYKLSNVFGIILSMPKTILFNFRSLPLYQAIKLPFFLWYNVKILETHKGIIKLPNNIHPFMIRMGKGGSRGVISNRHSEICLEGGELIFKGVAGFASGFSLCCSGKLIFGDHFSTNKNSFISSSYEVVFGDYCMLGWNCSVRDGDGHTVYIDGKAKQSQKPVIIGNHVWLASECHVLKGAVIKDNSIAAYRSLVTRAFSEENVLLTGVPASISQRNINWGQMKENLYKN